MHAILLRRFVSSLVIIVVEVETGLGAARFVLCSLKAIASRPLKKERPFIYLFEYIYH